MQSSEKFVLSRIQETLIYSFYSSNTVGCPTLRKGKEALTESSLCEKGLMECS